jgi:hypothetical protein
MMLNRLIRAEILMYIFLLAIYIIGILITLANPEYFNSHFAQEDGFVENMTALGLLMVAVLQLSRLYKLGATKPLLWKVGVLLTVIVFFFGAGEEISWGQRIFDIQSGEFFLQNNAQQETNLHNLVVSGKKVNKIIFTQLFGLVVILYLTLIPWLYNKSSFVKNTFIRFGFPIPRWNQVIVFVVFTLLMLTINADRKWELFEMTFAMIFALIFYHPQNKDDVYRQKD